MKILYTNFHLYHKGGHATYILSLFAGLRSKHIIHVADPVTSGLHEAMQKIAPDCLFAQTYPKRITALCAIIKNVFKLRKLIAQQGYDVIHVNGSPDLQMALIARLFLRKKPVIVYTKHNSIPISRNVLSVLKFKSAQEIIVVCGCQKEPFIEVGVDCSRITTIKNGLDTNHFKPLSDAERMKMRQQLGIAPDDFVLVSNAGTSPYKRWDCMMAAVGKIANPKIKVLIIGGDPTTEERAHFVEAFGMTERFVHVKPVEDVRPYVAAGDVGFVLSDQIETVSFACREMMSMGKPVIVSDFACLPENVINKKTGWVTPVGDVAAIQETIEAILENPQQCCKMGQAARVQAVQDFGVQTFVQATEAVYEKALSL